MNLTLQVTPPPPPPPIQLTTLTPAPFCCCFHCHSVLSHILTPSFIASTALLLLQRTRNSLAPFPVNSPHTFLYFFLLTFFTHNSVTLVHVANVRDSVVAHSMVRWRTTAGLVFYSCGITLFCVTRASLCVCVWYNAT